MRKPTKDEVNEALAILRKDFKPGSTVWTVLRHASSSGMSRIIGVRKLDREGSHWRSRLVAKVTGFTFDEKREELRVGGCGMDMGFHVAYNLSSVLYPKGFGCIGDRKGSRRGCPSNDHSNGDRDYTRHSKARPHWHKDGGYALRHDWI